MIRTISLVATAMVAFAANSLLCRMALAQTTIDPATFTVLRLASGAIALVLLSFFSLRKTALRTPHKVLYSRLKKNANILGGITLFLYAICFSYAYIAMSTGTGALLLFGAVQLTMIFVGILSGERFTSHQWVGFILAFLGIVVLLLPSATTPSLSSAVIMVAAGIAWGIYSLLGKKNKFALLATTGNFIYASLLCIVFIIALLLFNTNLIIWDSKGVIYALASGIFASGCGYAIWYSTLPFIKSTTAATVQLSVPVLAAIMGGIMLAEHLSTQMAIASIMTLGGIYLVIKKVNLPNP
ncbi:DMT family transporter [Alteromonas gracilis]|uniref:DMT family transporter n=1 Tax=Alteromonas gracilis TaxID=1479524 RepID=UPI003735A67C